jgi:uncharacterized protein YceH (UPF0502 family)
MSSDSGPASSAHTWEPLPPIERRILGVLVEKQKTSKSADAYPLTLNALVTGCNQKSNRDPVLDLDEVEVENALMSLQKKGLVIRITGGRAERFKHTLYENWTQVGPELAVLAELLLRGPQTKGDLRVRASRMAPIETLEALDSFLQPLVERRLVVFLTDPDRRGAVLTHGFHPPEELVPPGRRRGRATALTRGCRQPGSPAGSGYRGNRRAESPRGDVGSDGRGPEEAVRPVLTGGEPMKKYAVSLVIVILVAGAFAAGYYVQGSAPAAAARDSQPKLPEWADWKYPGSEEVAFIKGGG